MTFPSLRAPPRRERQDATTLTHLRLWFRRTFKARHADQTRKPSPGKSWDGVKGAKVEPLVNPAVQ